MSNIFFCFLILTIGFCYGQEDSLIEPPLSIPLKLSGNFGEFRATHFHAGIDIKTNENEGYEVKSIAEGYVSRIKISTSGYGKVIYINHPNSTTSVYAHLQKFSSEIEKEVRKIQYGEEKFTINKYFKRNEIPIEKGQVIGYSGNTGGSFGPHLHFEVRETNGQLPINPLQLGYNIEDTIKPKVSEFFLYEIDEGSSTKKIKISFLNNEVNPLETKHLKLKKGQYGVGLKVYDRQSLSYNKNGIYNAEVKINGKKIFFYSFDKMSFKDGQLINTLIDYKAYKSQKKRIIKMFRELPFEFSFLSAETPNGIFEISQGRSYKLEVKVGDYHKNETKIVSFIEGVEGIKNEEKSSPMKMSFEHKIKTELDYFFQKDSIELYIPKNTFYENTSISLDYNDSILSLESSVLPQQKMIEISFPIPDTLNQEQWTIASVGKKGKLYAVSSYFDKNRRLKSKNGRIPNRYKIVRDSIAPSLFIKNFVENQNVSELKKLKFEAEDDFSGIKEYNAFVNNQWVLMEFEPKLNLLTIDLNEIKSSEKDFDLRIVVSDYKGNTAVLETHFKLN